MPYDCAIYHPGTDKIFATMGGHICRCNADTGLREAIARTANPVHGDMGLATTADGKLYVSQWNVPDDIGWVNEKAKRDVWEFDSGTMLSVRNTNSHWVGASSANASYLEGPRQMAVSGNKLWISSHIPGTTPLTAYYISDPNDPSDWGVVVLGQRIFPSWSFGVKRHWSDFYTQHL